MMIWRSTEDVRPDKDHDTRRAEGLGFETHEEEEAQDLPQAGRHRAGYRTLQD